MKPFVLAELPSETGNVCRSMPDARLYQAALPTAASRFSNGKSNDILSLHGHMHIATPTGFKTSLHLYSSLYLPLLLSLISAVSFVHQQRALLGSAASPSRGGSGTKPKVKWEGGGTLRRNVQYRRRGYSSLWILLLYNFRQDDLNGGQPIRRFPAATTPLDPILLNLAMAEDVILPWRTFLVDGRPLPFSEKAVQQGSAENT